MTMGETQAEAGEALASIAESPMWVTRSVAKAKMTVAKVKWVAALATSIDKDGEARPSVTRRVFLSLMRFASQGRIHASGSWMTQSL